MKQSRSVISALRAADNASEGRRRRLRLTAVQSRKDLWHQADNPQS